MSYYNISLIFATGKCPSDAAYFSRFGVIVADNGCFIVGDRSSTVVCRVLVFKSVCFDVQILLHSNSARHGKQ